MKAKFIKGNKRKGQRLLLSIVLVFCAMGAVVYLASRQVSREMSSAAIQNLSESLDLIQYTIEAILRSEADFQTLIAQEIARAEDPEEYIRAYEKNQAMSKMSLILTGKTEGVSNTGEPFTEEGLDFSGGGVVGGMPVSQSYVNHMGTWSYTMKCPVQRDGEEIGTLYAEYVFDAIDRSLPSGFYDKQATLYIMDAQSQRFVLKPKGMGQRSAGHLNLADFYRANSIEDPAIQAEIDRCLNNGEKALFYHDIREEHALNYMWPVNGGSFFLVGYVPVEAIQQEGRTGTLSTRTSTLWWSLCWRRSACASASTISAAGSRTSCSGSGRRSAGSTTSSWPRPCRRRKSPASPKPPFSPTCPTTYAPP